MYLPPYHALHARDAQYDLIAAHPLGAWVCATPEGLRAHHLPWLLARDQGPHGTLRGHVARANPVWRALAGGAPSVVMFQGPQAYISPGWYPGKADHGRVVPTWNYVAVHAHGTAQAVDDRDWLLALLTALTDVHERARPAPWRVQDAPADYIDRLLGAVVGVEIRIERLEGRDKASQDEALEDRHGTVAGLRATGDATACAVAARVAQALAEEGRGPPPGTP